ncbi:MAG: MBL fold metallo-hydrolase [Pseudomonadota bacterium]
MNIPLKYAALPALALTALIGCGGESPPPAAPVAPPPAAAPAPPPPVAEAAPAPPAPKLQLQVITGSPEGFLVNSTLITGDKEAVLIDSELTLADGKRVADAVTASKKTLTTVFVTHFHPDHYFGFVAVKEAFPNAKLVALPATVEEIQKTWEAKVKQWKPMFHDAIPAKPLLPEPLAGDSLTVDGVKLEVVGAQQGDSPNNSYVWIPSLRAVITGDIVYDDVFPWTAETTPETRKAWAGTLDKLSALNPEIVVPGHQKADHKQAPSSIGFTKAYLAAWDEALAASKKPADLQAKIKAKYPGTALDVIVKIGADAAFAKPEKPKAEKAAPAAKADKADKANKADKAAPAAKADKAAAPAAPGKGDKPAAAAKSDKPAAPPPVAAKAAATPAPTKK